MIGRTQQPISAQPHAVDLKEGGGEGKGEQGPGTNNLLVRHLPLHIEGVRLQQHLVALSDPDLPEHSFIGPFYVKETLPNRPIAQQVLAVLHRESGRFYPNKMRQTFPPISPKSTKMSGCLFVVCFDPFATVPVVPGRVQVLCGESDQSASDPTPVAHLWLALPHAVPA